MKLKSLVFTSLLMLTPLLVKAGPMLITGTPGNNNLDPVTGPSPNLGGLLIDFPLSSFPYNASGTSVGTTYTSGPVTISSPDGLAVYPDSDQGPSPNFLYDDGTDGTFDGAANITINVAGGTTAIGVGIADSDNYNVVDSDNAYLPVNITLQALGAGDTLLGSAFTVNIPESTVTAGNGYYVVEDTTPDIYGLEIIAPTTDESGLAIADVQVAPEPSSLLLLIGGAAMIGAFRLRIGAFRLRKKALL